MDIAARLAIRSAFRLALRSALGPGPGAVARLDELAAATRAALTAAPFDPGQGWTEAEWRVTLAVELGAAVEQLRRELDEG